jgi:protein O-mannosyl-transferase
MKPESRNPKLETPCPADVRSGRAFSLQPLAFSLCVLLAVVTLWVYLPVWRHGYVSYDDPVYVTGNRHVQGGLSWAGVKWAFGTGYAGNWHPVTWLSHMLDRELFGPGPMGPHGVNVGLHVVNTLLVFLVLQRLTGSLWRSAVVAALFALHPLHVESVAWVAERKDVLSGMFFLLSVLAYTSYVSHKAERSLRYYLLSLFFFGLGLMSKPMLVTLPLVLLLLDYWPLRRFTIYDLRFTIWPLIREKVPFLVFSVVSCVITYLAQKQGGAVQSLASYSLGERLGNAAIAYARYLGKTFWPVDLAVPYPHPGQWPVVEVLMAAVVGMGLCLLGVWFGRRLPFIVTGWYWYVGMLVPVIGLVQVGDQAMADRYTYLPLIGVFVVVAWGAGEMGARWRWAGLAAGAVGVLVLVACGVQTRAQLRYWHGDESLFGHAVAVTERNYVAHNNLGNALLEGGRAEEAIVHFRRALEIKPDYADAHINLGNAFLKKGQADQALARFRAALTIQPASAEAHYNLGSCLLQAKQVDAAIVHFREAIAVNPDHVMARNNLGNALIEKGQLDEAILQYRAALALRPDFVVARHNLGSLLLQRGQTNEAIAHFRKVVELQPASANAHNNLGWMLRLAGRLDEAEAQLQQALKFRPDYPEAHYNLAKTLLLKGQAREAVAHLRTALNLQPEDPQNLSGLAWVLATWPDASVRNGAEALELAQKAGRITGGPNPVILQTLAAAHAENGQFEEAARVARLARQLADAQPNAVLAEELQWQIELYESGAPFRETLQSR